MNIKEYIKRKRYINRIKIDEHKKIDRKIDRWMSITKDRQKDRQIKVQNR